VRKIVSLLILAILILMGCNSGKLDLRKMKHSLDVKLSKYFDALTNNNKMAMYTLEPKWRTSNLAYSDYMPTLLKERREKKFVSAFVRDIRYDLLHKKAIVTVHFMKEFKPSPTSPVILKPAFIEKQLWIYKNGEWGYSKTIKRIYPQKKS